MAYISHSRKLIFIAPPKTGTTSVLNAMNQIGDLQVTNRHERAIEAKSRLRDVWDDYESFGFVRHPMKWLDSYWRFLGNRSGPISSIDKFIAWTPTIYDWFCAPDGNLLIKKVYRLEDIDSVMAGYGLSSFHANKNMNRGLSFALGPEHEPLIRQKFHREYAHYN